MHVELNQQYPGSQPGALPLSYACTKWSSRQDLNLRPSRPRRDALAMLSYY